jgi:hypothetical protein
MESTFTTTRRVATPVSAILLLILGVVIAVTLAAALIAVPALMRGGTTASPIDRSYDQVEKGRALFGAAIAQDASYDQVEKARVQVVLPDPFSDHSYDDVERIRSQAGN